MGRLAGRSCAKTHTERAIENCVLNLFFNLSLVRHVHNAMIMESCTYVNLHILTRGNLTSPACRRCCRAAGLPGCSHSFHSIIHFFWHSLFHLLFFFLNLISRSRTYARSSSYVCMCLFACSLSLRITRIAINAQINYVIVSFIIYVL